MKLSLRWFPLFLCTAFTGCLGEKSARRARTLVSVSKDEEAGTLRMLKRCKIVCRPRTRKPTMRPTRKPIPRMAPPTHRTAKPSSVPSRSNQPSIAPTVSQAPSGQICNQLSYNPSNHHGYAVLPTYNTIELYSTWAQANATVATFDKCCNGKEPHLASIQDQHEQDFMNIFITSLNSASAWLGLIHPSGGGKFVWTDGTPFSFVPATGFDAVVNYGQFGCGLLRFNDTYPHYPQWIVSDCTSPHPWMVVEYDCE